MSIRPLLWGWVALVMALSGCKPSGHLLVANHEDRPRRVQLDVEFGLPASAVAMQPPVAAYEDVAAEQGLKFQYYNDAASGNLYLPEALGGGAAAFDFDLDGWCDLFLTNGRQLPAHQLQRQHCDAVFRNQGGQFVSVTDPCFLREFDYSHGCAVGDFNADGFEDLLVANWGRSRLFINQGDGTFVEHPCPIMGSRHSFWVAPLFVDLDGDGWEDLLVASYVDWDYDSERELYEHGWGYPSPGPFNGGPYLVLRNMGNGQFADATEEWGFTTSAKCLGIAAVDLDHDLQPEIYVANDGTANALFSRTRDLQVNSRITNAARPTSQRALSAAAQPVLWQDIAEWTGTAGAADGLNEASMCVTLADFFRNGWTDIFVTNYYMKKHTLYANKGELSFRDVSKATRLDVGGRPFVSFGAVPIDFNLDGWWDVLVANGHVLGPQAPLNEMPCQLLENYEGVFLDVSHLAGDFFAQRSLARCAVTIDTDNDGLPEVGITHTDRPFSLIKNQSSTGKSWFGWEVFDRQHRSLVGGRVVLQFSSGMVTVPITAGGSYIGESQRRWALGLGESGEVPRLTVYWPDGTVDAWESLAPQAIWRLAPGRAPLDVSQQGP